MSGMVEKRGRGYWFTHAGLILGVLVIFFPIYLAFVASTVSQPDIVRPPMPLIPGSHFLRITAKPSFPALTRQWRECCSTQLSWRSVLRLAKSSSRSCRRSPSFISAFPSGKPSSG
jgi:ABC-type glycerol-3-phosphate transport system permease component